MPKLTVVARFGITPNQVLNDPKMSRKAKWIYWYIQSKPDDWDFAVARITNDAKDGEKSTIAWVHELEKAWYLARKKYQTEKGFWDVEWILYESPCTDNRQQENPSTQNPVADNPVADNRQTNKKRNTKKEIQKKKYIDNEKIDEKFCLFLEHRRQMKKPMTEVAISQSLEKIDKWILKYDEKQILFIIWKSIENWWQWLFEDVLKNYAMPKNHQTKPEEKTAFHF